MGKLSDLFFENIQEYVSECFPCERKITTKKYQEHFEKTVKTVFYWKNFKLLYFLTFKKISSIIFKGNHVN